jgi:hypothetical protein
MTSTEPATPSLQAFLNAFNAHDVDDPRHPVHRGADRGPRLRPLRVRRRQDQPEGLLLEDPRVISSGVSFARAHAVR